MPAGALLCCFLTSAAVGWPSYPPVPPHILRTLLKYLSMAVYELPLLTLHCLPIVLTLSNMLQIALRGWWMEAITMCPLSRAMRFR